MRFLQYFSAVLFLLVAAQPSRAHQVNTVELEFQRFEGKWRLVGEMDIAYMLPETRKVPGAQPLSREAVMKAPPEELDRIRKETEKTLRHLLRMTFAGKEVPWRIEFPDFDKVPFELPDDARGWALLTARLVTDAQASPGEFKVHWSGEEESELVILTEDSEEGQIISVRPGGEITLAKVVEDGKPAVATGQTSMQGWINTGFHHVVPMGLDHMLFILGLFLMIPKWQPLLKQSLMFTLAHSVTLALCVFGWVSLPSRLVEILIAFSIAFIGVENLFSHKVGRLRLILVLGFGLIHGMGFASVLAAKLDGIPRDRLAAPLLGFNLGVELAQITVLAAAFLLLCPLAKWTRGLRFYGSILIVLAGTGWMIERICMP
ncbi:MAG: HupE/UreJ family protein [Verrucomicrobiota bacterium]